MTVKNLHITFYSHRTYLWSICIDSRLISGPPQTLKSMDTQFLYIKWLRTMYTVNLPTIDQKHWFWFMVGWIGKRNAGIQRPACIFIKQNLCMNRLVQFKCVFFKGIHTILLVLCLWRTLTNTRREVYIPYPFLDIVVYTHTHIYILLIVYNIT